MNWIHLNRDSALEPALECCSHDSNGQHTMCALPNARGAVCKTWREHGHNFIREERGGAITLQCDCPGTGRWQAWPAAPSSASCARTRGAQPVVADERLKLGFTTFQGDADMDETRGKQQGAGRVLVALFDVAA